jgi:hypothetical protein
VDEGRVAAAVGRLDGYFVGGHRQRGGRAGGGAAGQAGRDRDGHEVAPRQILRSLRFGVRFQLLTHRQLSCAGFA